MTTVPTNRGLRAKSNLLQLLARLGHVLQSAIGARNASLAAVRVHRRTRRRS